MQDLVLKCNEELKETIAFIWKNWFGSESFKYQTLFIFQSIPKVKAFQISIYAETNSISFFSLSISRLSSSFSRRCNAAELTTNRKVVTYNRIKCTAQCSKCIYIQKSYFFVRWYTDIYRFLKSILTTNDRSSEFCSRLENLAWWYPNCWGKRHILSFAIHLAFRNSNIHKVLWSYLRAMKGVLTSVLLFGYLRPSKYKIFFVSARQGTNFSSLLFFSTYSKLSSILSFLFCSSLNIIADINSQL